MIRRPPRSTLDRSSAASDVYKRQTLYISVNNSAGTMGTNPVSAANNFGLCLSPVCPPKPNCNAVSYTHLRAHETVLDLVCRLLLEKKKQPK